MVLVINKDLVKHCEAWCKKEIKDLTRQEIDTFVKYFKGCSSYREDSYFDCLYLKK
jgi:hypothetical protein